MPVSFPASPVFPVLRVPAAFPRIANSNAYGQGGMPVAATVPTFARNGLVIVSSAATDPALLKARNPGCLALMYVSTTTVQVNSLAAGVPLAGMTLWPGWWGTMSGTRLAAAITNTATSASVAGPPIALGGAWGTPPFAALISTPGHASDEVVVVTAVTGDTLTISRGAWQSTGQAQPAGARIAQLPNISSGYPLEFYANITAYCPSNPSGGQRWADYLASWIVAQIYTTFPTYDGVFLDNAKSYPLDFPNSDLDADGNNISDGFNGPDGRGLHNGVQNVLAALRHAFAAQSTQKIILTNGSAWSGQSDGMYFESYQKTYGSSPPPFVQRQNMDRVRAYSANALTIPVTLSNTDLYAAGSIAAPSGTSIAYSYDFQELRFGLTQALMGDGYFSYDWCPTAHGQSWSFDEYDKGAGTALTSALLTTDTVLAVVNSAGFTAGQTIRVPHAVKMVGGNFTTQTEDEIMTVNGAPPDGTHINVTRSASVKGGQITGTKVLPDYGAGLPTWLGWMGQALGNAAENTAALTAEQLGALNGGFETSTPVTSPDYPPQSTFTNWSLNVQNTQVGFAFMSADTQIVQSGTKACRLMVTRFGVNFYDVSLQSAAVNVTSGNYYTISWWARGDRQQQYQVRVWPNGPATKGLQQMVMSNQWTQYRMTFLADTTGTYNVVFEIGLETGNYWFDTVQFHAGDPNVWTRDFEHAYAILNGTNASVIVTLPAIANPSSGHTTYQRIAGSQVPSVNSGAAVAAGATVTIPALDGLVLTKA